MEWNTYDVSLTMLPSSNGAVELVIQTEQKEHKELHSTKDWWADFFRSVYTTLNNRCGTMCDIPQQRLKNMFSLTDARCKRPCHITTSCTEISTWQHSWARELCVGQRVLIRNYRPWVPGAITERQGPHSYIVKVSWSRVTSTHRSIKRNERQSTRDFGNLNRHWLSSVWKSTNRVYQFHLRQAQQLKLRKVSSLVSYLKRNRKPPDWLT